jgi:hypothetical protein
VSGRASGSAVDTRRGRSVHAQQTAAVAEIGERLVVNPGRISGPFAGRAMRSTRDFDGTADHAVLTAEPGRLSVELRRVAYSLEELRRITLESGMPHAEGAAQRLGA